MKRLSQAERGLVCSKRNEVLRLRCDRPAGHIGAHVQADGYTAIGWGLEPWPTADTEEGTDDA